MEHILGLLKLAETSRNASKVCNVMTIPKITFIVFKSYTKKTDRSDYLRHEPSLIDKAFLETHNQDCDYGTFGEICIPAFPLLRQRNAIEIFIPFTLAGLTAITYKKNPLICINHTSQFRNFFII